MNALVTLMDGEARTTSLMIAEGTENEHHAVIQLVRNYMNDLQEFGTLAFEMRKSAGRPTEFAALNEGQATFLLTLMRNNEIVVAFKKRLVKDFIAIKQSALNPAAMSRMQLLEMAMQAEQERLKLEQKVEVLEPKAEIADRLYTADGLFGFRQAAKVLNVLENKFRDWLIQHDWVYYLGKRLTGKHYPIKAGYIVERVKLIQVAGEDDKSIKEMYFTSKGLHRLAENFNTLFEQGEAHQ